MPVELEPWPELEGLGDKTSSFRLTLSKDDDRRALVHPALWALVGLSSLDLSAVGLRRLDAEHPSTEEGMDDDCIEVPAAPPGLRQLKSLRDLALADNVLGPVLQPDGVLHGLSSLRSLDLQGNALASLPAALVSLTALNSLNIGRNQLQELPWISFSLLPELRLLVAPYNALAGAAVPPGVAMPPALKELSMRGNKLTEEVGLAPLGNLQMLCSLDIAENALAGLPQELATGCPKLSRLDVAGNPFVDKKLAKLAEGQSEQAAAKPILEVLRKGQSRRQMKAEKGSSSKQVQHAPRLYVPVASARKDEDSDDEVAAIPVAKSKKGKKGKGAKAPTLTKVSSGPAIPRRIVTVSRDVLAVRPHFLAVLLHVAVDQTLAIKGEAADSDDDQPKCVSPHFFFAEGCPDDAESAEFNNNFESCLGLLESGVGGAGFGAGSDVVSSAVATATDRLKAFVAAQTRIHAAPDLGNKRRAGALGAHNAEKVSWPLRFQAIPHDEVSFAPLSIGWMQEKGVVSAGAFAREAVAGRISGAPKDVSDALQRPAAQLLSMPLCPHLTDAQGKVLSVHPLSNGWETRNTADAHSCVLLECSSATSEATCRRMLLALIRDAIELIEGGDCVASLEKRKVRLLVEPVDVVCEWDRHLLRAEFPNHEELLSLPPLPAYCGAMAADCKDGNSDSCSD
mmetsp:Transcript_32794/g.64603  ORF Transcript_32794/g.64603 Transcript_32794/m.64603 type:complete len:681 (-) Transcript_32794:127-2169(-)